MPLEFSTPNKYSNLKMENVIQAAELMRRVLLVGLCKGEDGIVSTEGSCLHASVMLKQCLKQFKFAKAVVIRGGSGENSQGLLGVDGDWHGHYWLEVKATNNLVYLLDITADQFGHQAIVCELYYHLNGFYRAGSQEDTDIVVSEIQSDLGIR